MGTIRAKALVLFLLLSLLFWIAVIAVNPFPTATLEGFYTDHLNYETSAWFFLQRGFDVFRVPIGELAATCQAQRPHPTWAELPYDKTLGNLIIFIPFGALNNLTTLPETVVHKLIIGSFAVVAHLAMYYFVDELRKRRITLAISATLSVVFYLSLMHWTLNGFPDAISILFIILTIRFLREEENTRALLCYTMSVFLHYRALYLLPLGIYVLLSLYRNGELGIASLLKAKTSKKLVYGFTAVACALTIYTAYLSFIAFPYSRVIKEVFIYPGTVAPNLLNPEFFSPMWAIPAFAITGLAALYLLSKRELLTASTMVTSLLFLTSFPCLFRWYPLFLFPVALFPRDEKSRWIAFFWILSSMWILIAPWYPLNWLSSTVEKWREAL